METTYDPKTNKVNTQHNGEIFASRSFEDWYANRIVVQHLHYSGELSGKILTPAEENYCWTLADGFGPGLTIEYIAKRLEFDWSHIRDSSAEAIKSIASYILRKHYAGAPTIEQEAQKWLNACSANKVNPINPAEKVA